MTLDRLIKTSLKVRSLVVQEETNIFDGSKDNSIGSENTIWLLIEQPIFYDCE